MKRNTLSLLLMITAPLIPATSFAFFCPTNFNQINIGDTMDQVNSQCGKPDKQTTSVPEDKVPQEWVYFIPQTVGSNYMSPVQGTLKSSFTFDENGKAISIIVNGVGVGSTTLCGNTNLALNATTDQVKAACGTPMMINKQQSTTQAAAAPATPGAATPPPANQLTAYTYNSNPPVTLVFQYNKLIEKK